MNWRRAAIMVVVLLAVAANAGGCGTRPRPGPEVGATPPVGSGEQSPVLGDDGVDTAPSAPPQAQATAEAFAVAWARPDLAPAAWLAQVTPYATPGYAKALSTVAPGNIAAHAVTGPAVAMSSTTVVNVYAVPTDAGVLHVTCVLLGDSWRVATVALMRTPP